MRNVSESNTSLMADIDVANNLPSPSSGPSFVSNGLLPEVPFVPNGLLAGDGAIDLKVTGCQTQGAPSGTSSNPRIFKNGVSSRIAAFPFSTTSSPVE